MQPERLSDAMQRGRRRSAPHTLPASRGSDGACSARPVRAWVPTPGERGSWSRVRGRAETRARRGATEENLRGRESFAEPFGELLGTRHESGGSAWVLIDVLQGASRPGRETDPEQGSDVALLD